MSFAVSQPVLLIVSVAEERFFTLCTTEMVDMELFTKCVHYSFVFDWLLAGSTDRNHTHLVVATETVQLVAKENNNNNYISLLRRIMIMGLIYGY